MRRRSNGRDTAEGKCRCDPRTDVQAAALEAARLGQIHLGDDVGLPLLIIARRWRACCRGSLMLAIPAQCPLLSNNGQIVAVPRLSAKCH